MRHDPDRVVYVNGDFTPASEARISVFDRGFLFGDGVYEVSSVIDGKLIDNAAHLARLDRSMRALEIARPATDEAILAAQRELIARNALVEGLVYLQVTRGAAERDFSFPTDAAPSLVMFTQAKAVVDNPKAETGISVALVPDLRWKRRDIKTVNLLPASWAKHQAAALGADDAWMVETDGDGVERITEGSSNNAYIVTAEGVVVTRQLGTEILHGITRKAVLKLAEEAQIRIEERAFTPEEAKAAVEAFSTSASGFVMPVVSIDGAPVGDGRPGPIARRLRGLYIEMARAEASG
ncbi:MAG: D-amino-acid transaminase [Pseudomonadota bacterium]